MRKLIVSEFVTLDGVMEGPGTSDSFKQSGWTLPYHCHDIEQLKYTELMASDTLLLGRITYDGFAKAWPKMEGTGAFGEKINAMQKYVVSKTLKTADWENTTVIRDNIVSEVKKLKELPGKDILVFGSSDLVTLLRHENLVDQYTLLVYPVILGTGKHLFHDGSEKKLDLSESIVYETGVVLLRYAEDMKNPA